MELAELSLWSTGSFALGVVVVCSVERLRPYRPGQALFRRGVWTDFFAYSIAQGWVMGFIMAQLLECVRRFAPPAPFRLADTFPIWTQLLLALVTHDLALYWFHRWQHHSPILWRTHEPHHTNPELDWLAGSRASPLEIVLTELMKYTPLVVLGASPEVAILRVTVDAVWGMYLHSNIDVRSGWLQYVINGPELHRWHHALDPEARDRNFGTKFAVWDLLFGSVYWPRERVPSGYGLPEGEPSGGYWGQQLYSLRPWTHTGRSDVAARG